MEIEQRKQESAYKLEDGTVANPAGDNQRSFQIDVDGTPAAYEKEVRVADARQSVQAGKDEAERVRLLDEQVAAIKLDPSAVKSIRERLHDPDLRLAAMYDSELNGGVRLDGGQAKAEHYYLAYLPRVKNSAERCGIYSQLSVLFSTNWHPEMGESPDYPKSRRYAAEAIKAEPHRVGKATIRARARVRDGPDMSSEELFDGRLVLYKWLASWDETNTGKNWLPLRSEANNPDRHLRAFRNLLESVRQSERNNLLGSGGKQPQARLLRVVREAPGTEAAKIAEQKLEELWGEAVDGVQAMLIVERRDWDFGDQPGLKAMIRNRGDTDYEVAQAQQVCELEVDGRLYRWVGAVRVRSSHFPPRRTFEDIPITLDNHWQDKESGKPLVLEAGRYNLRLAFLPQQRVGADPIRVVSNRVEVRVEPAKQ